MIKFAKIIFILALFIFSLKPALADDSVNIYFFYGDGCPHCKKEAVFLDKLKKELGNIKIYEFEVWNSRENALLLAGLARELNLANTNVPITIIGDSAVPGFLSEATTGETIRSILDYYAVNTCRDVVAPILGISTEAHQCSHGCDLDDAECLHDCGCQADNSENKASSSLNAEKIDLPFIGAIDIKKISLPVLTILIGALDGFNPCAMWALLFLISLLLGMKYRRKMWILGSVFIFASGLVYFLFMAAWLNLFLFLGFIFWIRIGIAIVALFSGVYHLREYWKNRDGKCKITDDNKRKNYFNRLKKIVIEEKFVMSLVGIIILAASVNLVELLCSAGLPAVYTQVLALSNLNPWQYYGYLLVYIFIFMLDDLLIFVLAMVTLQMKAFSSKYTRWASLVGGGLMIVIGLLLIFKPGWLMFG